MKKILLFVGVILSSTYHSWPSYIQFSSSKVLYNRFRYTSFCHFIENTDVIQKLGDQTMTLNQVLHVITKALQKYSTKLEKNSYIPVSIDCHFNELMKIILKDSPEVYKQFQENVLIQSAM